MLNLALILLSFIFCGGQQPPQKTVKHDNPTRFELSAKKTTCHIAEPVDLTAAFYNDREKLIKGNFSLSFQSGLQVYYRKLGGEFVRYYPRRLLRLNFVDVITQPSEIEIPGYGKLEREITLFYNNNQFVLAEPGAYEFKVIFITKDRTYESTVVQLKVIESPQDEATALAALKDPKLAQFVEGDIRWGIARDEEVEEGTEKAAEFLQTYNQSLYAPIVQERLWWSLTDIPSINKTPKLEAIYNWLKPIYKAQHPE